MRITDKFDFGFADCFDGYIVTFTLFENAFNVVHVICLDSV